MTTYIPALTGLTDIELVYCKRIRILLIKRR